MRGDILPRQIPVQGGTVGMFTHAAWRDALPPSDRKGVTEETQSSFFFFFFFGSCFQFFFLVPMSLKTIGCRAANASVPSHCLVRPWFCPSPREDFSSRERFLASPRRSQSSGAMDGALSAQAFQCLCPGVEMDKRATMFYDIFL